MPWRIMSIFDERKKFIDEALNLHRRVSFADLCEKYNISTKTGYKWLSKRGQACNSAILYV